MEVDGRLLEVTLQPPAMDGEVEEEQAARFITSRQLCLLWGVPCVFLFSCMLIFVFALKYTHGSIWFSAFSAILMAIPMTEVFFIIYGMMNSDEEPPSPPDVEVGEQLVDSLQYNSTEARDKMLKCILRGLILLAWLFMIDFIRRDLGRIPLYDIPIIIICVTMVSVGVCIVCQMIEGVGS